MENIEPNIPLIPDKYYEFNYDDRNYTLRYNNRDDEGLHFDELVDDIVWDFIIPPNRIESTIFTEDFEGHTDVEEFSQEAGRIRHRRRAKRTTIKRNRGQKSSKRKKTYKKTKKNRKIKINI